MEPFAQPEETNQTKQWLIIGISVLIIAVIGAVSILKFMPSHLDTAKQYADIIRWEEAGQIDDVALAQQHFSFINSKIEYKIEHAHAVQLLGRLQVLLNKAPNIAIEPASPWFKKAAELAPSNYTNWLLLVASLVNENASTEEFNHAMKFALRQGRNEELALQILPGYILRHWDELDDKNRKLSARFFDTAFDTHEWAIHILNVTQETNQYDVMLSLIPDRPKYKDILVYYKQKDRG